MNFRQSVQISVENIKDELNRISSLATSFHRDLSGAEPGMKKLQEEYNNKLRKLNTYLERARRKNLELSERVEYLEAKLRSGHNYADANSIMGRSIKSEGDFRPGPNIVNVYSLTKKRKSSHPDDILDILSSPIKDQTSYLSKGNIYRKPDSQIYESGGDDITSSQFNKLATQYSDSVNQHENSSNAYKPGINNIDSKAIATGSKILFGSETLTLSRKPSPRKLSPRKRTLYEPEDKMNVIQSEAFASEDDSDGNVSPDMAALITDSQDELASLIQDGKSPKHSTSIQTMKPMFKSKSNFPSHYTALQRIEFLRNYLQPKFTDKNFKLDLSRNPITEKNWALEDFVPNENWKPSKKIHSNLGVMTKAQEKTYHAFFTEAGLGRRSAGPVWDSDEASDHYIDGTNWVRSQVMDKYSSPPGYMVGDFANTQDMEATKQLKHEKEQERIKRRLRSAISGGEFLFYEAIFNDFVSVGRYVSWP